MSGPFLFFASIAVIAAHERDALSGFWSELRERAAVARRARGFGELLRDQIDLLPETRVRLREDQRLRLELWRGLARELRGTGRLGPRFRGDDRVRKFAPLTNEL